MSTRTALVTGSSSGIGLEFARLFAADHHDVVLVARSRDRLLELSEELEQRHGTTARIIPTDLAQPGAAAGLADRLESEGIAIDALVNSAGFALNGPFAEDDIAEQSGMINVNVTALTELTRRLLPGMLERDVGRIVMLASIASFQPGPLMAAYYASKAYVLSLSLALTEETRGTGVSVTCLAPGPVRSGFQARAEMEDARLVAGKALPDAREIAEIGYRGMKAGKPLVLHGLANRSFALATRLLPRSFAARIAQRTSERVG